MTSQNDVGTNSIGRQMASKLSGSLAPDDDSSTLLAHNDNDSHTPGSHILVFFLSYCSYVVTLIFQCTYISYMVYIIPKFIESHKITECLNIGLYKIFTFNVQHTWACTGSFHKTIHRNIMCICHFFSKAKCFFYLPHKMYNSLLLNVNEWMKFTLIFLPPGDLLDRVEQPIGPPALLGHHLPRVSSYSPFPRYQLVLWDMLMIVTTPSLLWK